MGWRRRVNKEEEEDEDGLYQPAPVISVGKVHELIGQLKDYAVFHGHNTILNKLMDLSDEVCDVRSKTCKKQSSISDFFLQCVIFSVRQLLHVF